MNHDYSFLTLNPQLAPFPLRHIGVWLVVILLAHACRLAVAEEPRAPIVVPQIQQAPKLDGILDDAAWTNAFKGTLRELQRFDAGNTPVPLVGVETTYIYVMCDTVNLYLAFECIEPAPEKIVAKEREPGGNVWNDDVVEIFLNPSTSAKAFLHFGMNSLGVGAELGLRDDGQNIYLRSEWKAAAKVHKDRWIVEMTIPFAGLGVGQDTPGVWTANFCRNRKAGGKYDLSVWQGGFNAPAAWAKMEFKGINFGRLEGADGGRLPTGNFVNGAKGWKLEGGAEVKEGKLVLSPGALAAVQFEPPISWTPVSVFPVTVLVEAAGESRAEAKSQRGFWGPLFKSLRKEPLPSVLRIALEMKGPNDVDLTLTKDVNLQGELSRFEENWSSRKEIEGKGTFQLVRLTLLSPRGTVFVRRARLGGPGLDVKMPPIYQPQFSADLSPRLQWLKTERLRLFYGFPLGITPRSPSEFVRVDKMLDRIVEGGFNAVAIGGHASSRREDQWMAWIGMRSMIQAWKRGLRVFAHTGYLWRDEDPDYGPPAMRKINEKGELVEWLDARLKMSHFMISPMDIRPWQSGFAKADDTYAYADELGLPDLLVGVHFDDETLTHLQNYDYSDEAFSSYFKACGISAPLPKPAERHYWLMMEGKLKDYQRFQEEEVSRRIKPVADMFYSKHPDALIFVYNFIKEEWADRAWVRALSSPRRPAILMDDQTYFSGYSGNPSRIPDGIRATHDLLGYDPMYCGAFLPVCDPPYPMSSPEKAAQEMYLFVRASNGGIIYTGSRGKEDMYETHLPYFVEWRNAFESLQKESVIQTVPVPVRSSQETARADAALRRLDEWARDNWFKVWAPHPRLRYTVVTDPPAVRSEAGGAIMLTKNLMADSLRKDGPARIGNQLSPCHSLSYRFTVPSDLVNRKAFLMLKFKAIRPDQTYLRFVVNGVSLPLQGPGITNSISVELPAGALKEATTIEIAYFYGNSIYTTIFDHFFELQELTLKVQ